MKKAFICLFLLLQSCARLQGPYTPPCIGEPKSWKTESDERLVELDEWWRLFKDPSLDELIQRAIENNKTEAVAYERMIQAYAEARYRYGALYPVVSLAPFFFKQGSLAAGQQRETETPTTTPIIPPVVQQRRNVFTEVELPLTFFWELDLWGKLKQSYLDAFYTYENVSFQLQDYLNQLTADVASNFYRLRGYDSEIDLLNRLIASREENLKVNQERYTAGLINYLDVTRAEVDLGSARSERENIILERQIQENILAVLVGAAASDFSLPHNPLPIELDPPVIPTGLPSYLLERRPDVAAKEKAMQAYHAKIGVALANFFPDLILSGEIGFLNNQFQNLFDWRSRLWQFAISSTQILYNGNRLQEDTNKTVAAYKQTICEYEETVLESFRQVEDALITIKQKSKQELEMLYTTKAAEETYNLAMDRYNSGLINYLDVVVAERDLLTASRSATNLHADRFTATALLIKSLGGGW